jgi:hypothetical protein
MIYAGFDLRWAAAVNRALRRVFIVVIVALSLYKGVVLLAEQFQAAVAAGECSYNAVTAAGTAKDSCDENN